MLNEQELFTKMRALAQPWTNVTDNELGYQLRDALAVGTFALYKGVRHRSEWGLRCDTPLELEHVLAGANTHRSLFSTFRECIDVDLRDEEDGRILVHIRIHEGDSYDGKPTALRAELFLDGPWWTIEAFRDRIVAGWHKYCRKLADEEEDRKRNERAARIGTLLLAGQYTIPEDE